MKFISISTTSKHNKDYIQLPCKLILNKRSENFLVSNKDILKKIISENNYKDTYFLLDTEKKQGLSLYDEVELTNIIDYKPNDLTMEAADLAVLNFFNGKVSRRSVAILGTGNIAFKLALRLAERNMNVYIYGRDKKKVRVCVDALKQISFDSELIHYGNSKSKVEGIISFLSVEHYVDESYISILKKDSLCLDGGIGNFSKAFIETALKRGHDVRRLDVRQSQEIMDGYINSRINSQFNEIIGRTEIEGISVVAGGIMGREGELIVDRISSPSKVIGVANGIGGVKDGSELNDDEKRKIKKVQSCIKQACQKST